MPDFKALRDKFGKEPRKMLMNIIIIFLFGVLLILIGDISSSLTEKNDSQKTNSIEVDSNKTLKNEGSEAVNKNDSYEASTKEELVETLSEIEGVGKISVMINYESGEQSVPAFNAIDSSKRIEEKDNEGGVRVTTENSKNQEIVLVNNGSSNEPMIIKQYHPSISGVVVVAEGAENPVVKERLFHAVKTVLNLQGSKVSVMPMKKNTLK